MNADDIERIRERWASKHFVRFESGETIAQDIDVLFAALADRDARIAELEAERDKLKRVAVWAGKVIDRTHLQVIEITQSHDLIDADGDGDWELVWERLAELPSKVAARDARIAELEAELAPHREEVERQEQWAAYCRQADVRCLTCDLRYEERDQYRCEYNKVGGHRYAEDELADAWAGKENP